MRWLAPLLLGFAPAFSMGASSVLCAVAYDTPDGWSRESFVSVNFLGGSEVGERGGVFVEWPGNSLSSVEVGFNIGGATFSDAWIQYVFSRGPAVIANEQGGNERRWRVRCLDRGRWIDSRLNDLPARRR